MTIEEAREKISVAKRAYLDVGKYADAKTDEERDYLHEEKSIKFEAWSDAERVFHMLVANEAAATVENPISREDLVEELTTAIKSKLDFGEVFLRRFEQEQDGGHEFSRWSVRAKAADGGYRPISEAAFERAKKVLEKHCPRRSDTGWFAPPYKIKYHDIEGFIAVGGERDR